MRALPSLDHSHAIMSSLVTLCDVDSDRPVCSFTRTNATSNDVLRSLNLDHNSLVDVCFAPSLSLWTGQPSASPHSHTLNPQSGKSISQCLEELGYQWSGKDDCVLIVTRRAQGHTSTMRGPNCSSPSKIHESPAKLVDDPNNVTLTTESGVADLTHTDLVDIDSVEGSVGITDRDDVVCETDSEETFELLPVSLPGLKNLLLNRTNLPLKTEVNVTGSNAPLIGTFSNDVIEVSSSDEHVEAKETACLVRDNAESERQWRNGPSSPRVGHDVISISSSSETVVGGYGTSRHTDDYRHLPIDKSVKSVRENSITSTSCGNDLQGQIGEEGAVGGLHRELHGRSLEHTGLGEEGGREPPPSQSRLEGVVTTWPESLSPKDEGIEIESESDEDVLVVSVEGGERWTVRDEMIVSAITAQVHRRAGPEVWDVCRTMRRLRKVFGTEIDSRKELVQRTLSDLRVKTMAGDTLRQQSPPGRKVVTCCGVDLSQDDLNTLKQNQWLNDQIVNSYMQLLKSQCKGKRRLHITSTFFYPKLVSRGYQGVEHWFRNVDIFKLDQLLVPVHLGVHWCLAVIHFRRKTLEYYDSLGRKNRSCFKHLMMFLLKAARTRGHTIRFQHWRRITPRNIPQQHTSSDCGVFLCQFARWLCCSPSGARTSYSEIPFRQEHIPKIRRTMTEELVSNQLLNLTL